MTCLPSTIAVTCSTESVLFSIASEDWIVLMRFSFRSLGLALR